MRITEQDLKIIFDRVSNRKKGVFYSGSGPFVCFKFNGKIIDEDSDTHQILIQHIVFLLNEFMSPTKKEFIRE